MEEVDLASPANCMDVCTKIKSCLHRASACSGVGWQEVIRPHYNTITLTRAGAERGRGEWSYLLIRTSNKDWPQLNINWGGRGGRGREGEGRCDRGKQCGVWWLWQHLVTAWQALALNYCITSSLRAISARWSVVYILLPTIREQVCPLSFSFSSDKFGWWPSSAPAHTAVSLCYRPYPVTVSFVVVTATAKYLNVR